MLSHYNVISNVRQTLSPGITSRYGVYLDFLPFYHIYGMIVLMACGFAAGVPQVVMPRFDPALCLELIQRHKVTNLFAVPPALLALAQLPGHRQVRHLEPTHDYVRRRPPAAEVAARSSKALGTMVLQGYGMTETSPVTNVNPVTRIKDGTVGPPIADTIEKVVSLEDGRELGAGEVGELLSWARRSCSATGSAPTSRRRPCREGWIRTGDIVQWMRKVMSPSSTARKR